MNNENENKKSSDLNFNIFKSENIFNLFKWILIAWAIIIFIGLLIFLSFLVTVKNNTDNRRSKYYYETKRNIRSPLSKEIFISESQDLTSENLKIRDPKNLSVNVQVTVQKYRKINRSLKNLLIFATAALISGVLVKSERSHISKEKNNIDFLTRVKNDRTHMIKKFNHEKSTLKAEAHKTELKNQKEQKALFESIKINNKVGESGNLTLLARNSASQSDLHFLPLSLSAEPKEKPSASEAKKTDVEPPNLSPKENNTIVKIDEKIRDIKAVKSKLSILENSNIAKQLDIANTQTRANLKIIVGDLLGTKNNLKDSDYDLKDLYVNGNTKIQDLLTAKDNALEKKIRDYKNNSSSEISGLITDKPVNLTDVANTISNLNNLVIKINDLDTEIDKVSGDYTDYVNYKSTVDSNKTTLKELKNSIQSLKNVHLRDLTADQINNLNGKNTDSDKISRLLYDFETYESSKKDLTQKYDVLKADNLTLNNSVAKLDNEVPGIQDKFNLDKVTITDEKNVDELKNVKSGLSDFRRYLATTKDGEEGKEKVLNQLKTKVKSELEVKKALDQLSKAYAKEKNQYGQINEFITSLSDPKYSYLVNFDSSNKTLTVGGETLAMSDLEDPSKRGNFETRLQKIKGDLITRKTDLLDARANKLLGYKHLNALIEDNVRRYEEKEVHHAIGKRLDGQITQKVYPQVDKAIDAEMDRRLASQITQKVVPQVDKAINDEIDNTVPNLVDIKVHSETKKDIKDLTNDTISKLNQKIIDKVNSIVDGKTRQEVDRVLVTLIPKIDEEVKTKSNEVLGTFLGQKGNDLKKKLIPVVQRGIRSKLDSKLKQKLNENNYNEKLSANNAVSLLWERKLMNSVIVTKDQETNENKLLHLVYKGENLNNSFGSYQRYVLAKSNLNLAYGSTYATYGRSDHIFKNQEQKDFFSVVSDLKELQSKSSNDKKINSTLEFKDLKQSRSEMINAEKELILDLYTESSKVKPESDYSYFYSDLGKWQTSAKKEDEKYVRVENISKEDIDSNYVTQEITDFVGYLILSVLVIKVTIYLYNLFLNWTTEKGFLSFEDFYTYYLVAKIQVCTMILLFISLLGSFISLGAFITSFFVVLISYFCANYYYSCYEPYEAITYNKRKYKLISNSKRASKEIKRASKEIERTSKKEIKVVTTRISKR